MNRSKTLFWIFLFLCIFIAVKELGITSFRAEGIDFWKHYHAAGRVINGKSPYTGDLYLSFNYPQFVAWINLPLLYFKDIKDAERAWDIANIVLVLITIGIVIWGYNPSEEGAAAPIKMTSGQSQIALPWWLVAIFLTLFFAPNTDGLRPGNLSSWVLLFMVLAGWGVYRGKDMWTGVMIALSALIKVMPVFLLLPYIVVRRKGVIIGAAMTFGIYILILLVTGSLRYEIFLITDVLPNVGAHWVEVSYSVPVVLTRQLFPSIHNNPHQLQLLCNLWSLALFISYIVTVWKNRCAIEKRHGEYLIFIIGTLLLPIFPPLLEYHHFNWIFPGMLIAFYLARESVIQGKMLAIVVLGYFWLSIAGRVADVFTFPGLSLLSFNAPIALILYILFIRVLCRLKRSCHDIS